MPAEQTMTLEVFRYHPETDSEPRFQAYEVPYDEDWVVLDAINWIKDHVDGSLTYRWSCRMGVCGSCGMMVNGDPKLTCAVFLKDYYPRPIKVEPLVNFPSRGTWWSRWTASWRSCRRSSRTSSATT